MDRMSGSLAGLVSRTLDAIRDECPLAWSELLREGNGLHVALVFDGEGFALRGTGRDLRVGGPGDDANVRVLSTVDALRRVIMGERSLVESIERDEIFVTGDPAALVRLDRLTWLFVAGAARSDSAAPLLDELLEHCPKPTN